MKLSELDYDLPEELIAQTPLADRSESRMLVLRRESGAIGHRQFKDLPSLLESGDLVVVNNTRVDALRLHGQRPTGGNVEVFLIKHLGGQEYECLLRPGKRLKQGSQISFSENLTGTLQDQEGFIRHIRLDGETETELKRLGQTPLPPYIHQQVQDPRRYQTVYAQDGGSAAAPTAGLHFTPAIFDLLKQRGIDKAEVTLEVSLDTFKPVTVDDTKNHTMHGEICRVTDETCQQIAKCPGKVVAIGTTTARTLESFSNGHHLLIAGAKETKIFIEPGYQWQTVDALLTNFHLPRTTMLAMIASLAGTESIRRAYQEAILYRYRFLSFGDCMLIL